MYNLAGFFLFPNSIKSDQPFDGFSILIKLKQSDYSLA